MEARATSKYVRISPRKLKMIRDLVVGKEVNYAIGVLQNLPKRGVKYLVKTLRSALNNAEQKAEGKMWKVKNLFIDQGPSYKRFRAAPMGRAVLVKRRTSHITVIIEDIEGGEK